MKIVFMGTPDFAAEVLKVLAQSRHDVVGVICQSDKPVGRKQILTPPDTKVEAQKLGISVFQPKSLKNDAGVEILKQLDCDVAVVAAYGKILPADVLNFPKFGCVNVHASLLPKYRGASPVQWSVINGDKETGVTIMQMDEGLDTGDILAQSSIPINIDDTAEDMFEKLAPLGAKLLIDTLDKIESGEINPTKQNESEASKVGLLSKSDSIIDWTKSALEIHNKIRGLYSWPCTVSSICGKNVKIYRSAYIGVSINGEPGEVIECDKRLVVCAGDGKTLEIKELQFEGKKRLTAAQLLNGFKIPKGERFA